MAENFLFYVGQVDDQFSKSYEQNSYFLECKVLFNTLTLFMRNSFNLFKYRIALFSNIFLIKYVFFFLRENNES